MPKLHIVVPMAGRGSRFSKAGISHPKPLVNLGGRPFFWWAVESLRRATDIGTMIFVVLEEHEKNFGITQQVLQFYPQAQFVLLSAVTSGSAETALLGLGALPQDGPFAIQDCDHAFVASDMTKTVTALGETFDAALSTFYSQNSAYSYAVTNERCEVVRTVEKQVVSTNAIAGCYLFSSAKLYRDSYRRYISECGYDELFVSGVYNSMLHDGQRVRLVPLDKHFSFGTPDELAAIEQPMLSQIGQWRQG